MIATASAAIKGDRRGNQRHCDVGFDGNAVEYPLDYLCCMGLIRTAAIWIYELLGPTPRQRLAAVPITLPCCFCLVHKPKNGWMDGWIRNTRKKYFLKFFNSKRTMDGK